MFVFSIIQFFQFFSEAFIFTSEINKFFGKKLTFQFKILKLANRSLKKTLNFYLSKQF